MRHDALPSQPPPRPPGRSFEPDEGRIRRSWRLLGRCWDLLSERPRLLAMPALSAVSTTIAALAIFLPVLWWTRALPDKVAVAIAATAALLPFTLISTTANVAFLAMVDANVRGAEPRVRDGLRAAWRRRWPILGWSLMASGVGAILNALQHLPGGEWAGRLAGFLGGLAWGLATFFVVPVLAVEGLGPIASVKRSAAVFRRRWGETVAGDLTVGIVLGVAMVPGGIALCAGLLAFDDSDSALGALLLSAGIVLLAPLLAIQTALSELFLYALYRETEQGALPAPLTPADVGAAFTPRRRWFD